MKPTNESCWATEALAAEQLDKRRDDLARELSICGYDYLGAAPVLRKAIDRIISLQDERQTP